jgi:glycosyltransferase involved in cell wall biosynthesis
VLTSTQPPDLAGVTEDARPRVDFEEIARALGARLSYPPARTGGPIARIEEKTASDLRQALSARRAPASLYLSLSEKVGLPLSLFGTRGRPHVLIAHNLTSGRKRALQKRTGYLHRFDRVLVLCRTQEEYLRGEAGLPEEKVRFVYHNVDHRFFAPAGGRVENYVLSVGRERRDYETLMAAVEPLNVPTTIVASSPWSRGAADGQGSSGDPSRTVPANVFMRHNLTFAALRDLYGRAAVVVVPLQSGTDYAAGATGVLEAMAMRKPLIVSDAPGIRDYVAPGETACLVPPSNPDALARVIGELLADRVRAERFARNARQVIDHGRNLDGYVAAITAVVREVLPA